MLGANRRVVRPTWWVREDVPSLQAQIAVQHAGPATGKSGGMLARLNREAAGFDAHQPHAGIVHERVEESHGIAAATHATTKSRPAGRGRSAALWPITDWNSRTING